MDQALTAYFEGHYRRAEKFAGVALKLQESPALSAVVAARAAHEQRNTEARDNYLKAAEIAAPENKLLQLIAQAEFFVEDRRAREALDVLDVAKFIAPRNPAVMRLEVRAHSVAKNWQQVLECLAQLYKFKDFDRKQLEPLRLNALREILSAKHLMAQHLRNFGGKCQPLIALMPSIARAGANAFCGAWHECGSARYYRAHARPTSGIPISHCFTPTSLRKNRLTQIERAEVG